MATDTHSRLYQSRSSTAFVTRRPRHTVPSSASCPSFTLLSILGTIAASCSNVNASPAPPTFLCPSFDPNHSSFAVIDTGAEGALSLPTKRTGTLAGVPRSLPDQYKPDSDGVWRKVERYTLYGSTVCPTCGTPSGGPSPVDDGIEDDTSNTAKNSVSASPSPSYDITNSLPPGWKRTSSSSASRTTLILVLSLVLAFLICVVIISLVFWRKTKRRKHRHGDVEIEASKRHPETPDEDRESMVQKESKAKQKIWARATARWKANVRYTARQRRGKRMTSTNRMTLHNPSADLDQTQSGMSSSIPSPSGPPSPRSSVESIYSNSTVDVVIDFDHVSGKSDNHTQSSLPSPPASSHSPSHTSPPAYHQRVTSAQNSGSIKDVSDDPTPPSSSSPPMDSAEPIYAGPDVTLHLPHILAAHVATDDKSLLARLAESASSPPLSEESASVASQSSAPQVSVPVWRDEEFEDFPCDPGGSTSIHMSSSPAQLQVFPPPPCKGKMAAPAFYDYPYSFEDLTLEVEAGPSAPPFDDLPSAPPTNNIDLTPSAPPLMDTGYYAELSLSAVDRRPDDLPPLGVEKQDSLDQLIPSDSQRQADIACNVDTINAHVEGPVGMLPRYHP